jgi:hypothetical protein
MPPLIQQEVSFYIYIYIYIHTYIHTYIRVQALLIGGISNLRSKIWSRPAGLLE